MNSCPKCHRTESQNQAGKTGSGSQRYRCMYCKIKYTPEPKAWTYDEQTRQKALEMYVDGMSLRRIARYLGVHHRTVSLWVKAKAASVPAAPVPEEVKVAEMDELFTFIGEKSRSTSLSSSIGSTLAMLFPMHQGLGMGCAALYLQLQSASAS